LTINRKFEFIFLGVCAALAIFWAATTNYFSHLEFNLNWLINISSLLTVASFSAKGMLTLRLLAVASGALAIPYFMLQPTPLWTPVGWTGLFMAINLFHSTRILLERRPVKLADDEQRLYKLAFQNFAPREFQKLTKYGKWETAQQGDSALGEGQPITRIVVPISGSVSIQREGKEVAMMGPGELLGAGMVIDDHPSYYDAQFVEACRYMSWQKKDIERFKEKNPGLSPKLNDVVNRYLVAQINKLTSSTTALPI
jgi:CRP-like cAMP-binding protein